MQDLQSLTEEDLQGLSPEAVAALAQQMLQRLRCQDSELKFKDAKIEKITFQLARLKAWKFGAKTEAMSAEQRRLFEETCVEDEASLQAQLDQARGPAAPPVGAGNDGKSKPRRSPLPEHLRREEHRHEPANTNCPNLECGSPMTRIGEDVSERLDIIRAEFFVHRHIYGKWTCRCCQCLVQEAAAPQVIEGGMPAAGLIAHTLVSHFVDHLPYYRLETINARSKIHTPRSTLASWSGQGGAALIPLFDAYRRFVLSSQVLHVDETPVSMLDPGAGKTKRAYVWAYARGALDAVPGVVYDFCVGRSAQYPIAFLGGDGDERSRWRGTLVRDEYKAYDRVISAEPERFAAGCLAHARRKFDELLREGGRSAVATEALQRIAQIYRVERELGALPTQARLDSRQAITRPMWEQLHAWLQLECSRVPDGSATAKALNYSLNAWAALTHHLVDANVPVDNNYCENLIRPWAMGRKAWLFSGSELAGQRAAVVMSLVQSAKLNGHDPWAYLRDVLTRLPTQLNSRIEELLPHNWRPAN